MPPERRLKFLRENLNEHPAGAGFEELHLRRFDARPCGPDPVKMPQAKRSCSEKLLPLIFVSKFFRLQ
jgi:hypothetical protein